MISAESSPFKNYIDRLCSEVWSKVISLTTEQYQGRLHYKLTSQMLWYRTRYYVKLPVAALLRQEFEHSQFFMAYPLVHDEKQQIDGMVVLSRYVLIESENHLSLEACSSKRLSYQPKDMLNALKELDQRYLSLVMLSYEGYQLRMLSWPRNHTPPFHPGDVKQAAGKANIGLGAYQLLQFFGNASTKAINTRAMERLLTKKGTIQQYVAHSYRMIVETNHTIFVLEFLCVYYIKERYTERDHHNKKSTTVDVDLFFPEVRPFSGLFLLCSAERPLYMLGVEDKFVRCAHPQRFELELLEDAFSGTLERSKNLYKAMAESDLEKIFSSEKIKDQELGWIAENCRVGDLFYLDRLAYSHVGVYLGGDTLIHIAVATFSGVKTADLTGRTMENQLSGRMFQFSSFEAFCGTTEEHPKYEIVRKRMWFCPFSRQEIVEEALRMSERHVVYDVHSNNCEHMAVELVTGRNYSTQAGLLSFIAKPIISTGLYNVSW